MAKLLCQVISKGFQGSNYLITFKLFKNVSLLNITVPVFWVRVFVLRGPLYVVVEFVVSTVPVRGTIEIKENNLLIGSTASTLWKRVVGLSIYICQSDNVTKTQQGRQIPQWHNSKPRAFNYSRLHGHRALFVCCANLQQCATAKQPLPTELSNGQRFVRWINY